MSEIQRSKKVKNQMKSFKKNASNFKMYAAGGTRTSYQGGEQASYRYQRSYTTGKGIKRYERAEEDANSKRIRNSLRDVFGKYGSKRK